MSEQDLKGWRKYENFKLLRALYPTGGEPESFVFVGDTGELDKECGMRMLTSQSSAHKVKAVFLHVVRAERVHLPCDATETCFLLSLRVRATGREPSGG